jgi:hypothetical protein
MPHLYSFGATVSDTEEVGQGRHSYDTNNDTNSVLVPGT